MDPYSSPFDPLARLYGSPYPTTGFGPSSPGRSRSMPPLDPEEEQSALGKVTGSVLGGLGWVGSTMGKLFGGRAVRGVLGGKPHELLSLIPGSDVLGITNPEDEVSGKEVLGFKKDDDSWGATLAGLGTDIATDPSMWLAPFAATGAGKVARAIGKLPGWGPGRVRTTLGSVIGTDPALMAAAEKAAGGAANLAPLLGQRTGSVASLHLPFMWNSPFAEVGASQAGQDFLGGVGKAAGMLDAGLRKIPVLGHQYGWAADTGVGLANKVRPYLRAGFDRTAMEHVRPEAQEYAASVFGGIGGKTADKLEPFAGHYRALMDSGLDEAQITALIQGDPAARAAATLEQNTARRGIRGLATQQSRDRREAGLTSGLRPVLGNPTAPALEQYFKQGPQATAAADVSREMLARHATAVESDLTVPMQEALGAAGLYGKRAPATVLDRINALQNVQMQGVGGLHVPRDVVNDLVGAGARWNAPAALQEPLQGLDKVTNWFKNLAYTIWPSAQVRNLGSGQFNSAGELLQGGGHLGDLPRLNADIARLRSGETIQGLAGRIFPGQNLTDDQATKKLGNLFYAWGNTRGMPHMGAEATGLAGAQQPLTDAEHWLNQIWGAKPLTGGTVLDQYRGSPGDWMHILQPNHPAARAGRELGNLVESQNRLPLMLGLMEQGYTPEAAAGRVTASHFGYTGEHKTAFERSVMSRLFPFYTFTRHNVPYQVGQLMEHPGGPQGLLAKGAENLRQGQGFLPDFMGSGLAIPLGKEGEGEEGVRRYLTRLDLPPEQAFEMLHGGPGGTRRSGESLLSQLNPMLKFPLEYATGKQFFTGRDVGDIAPRYGAAADQLLANSPFSRLASTAHTLADERKWQSPAGLASIPLNLATGARITDVNMPQARQAEMGTVKDILRGQSPEHFGKFEELWLRPGTEQLLSPQEMEMYRLYRTLQQRSIAAARQRQGGP